MSVLMNLSTTNQAIDESNGPATQAPSSTLDVLGAAYDEASKNSETFSKANLINNIQDTQDEEFLNRTGMNIDDEIEKFSPSKFTLNIDEKLKSKEEARDLYINNLRETGEIKDSGLMTSNEVLEEARIQANESKANFNLIAENASATARLTGSFLGNMGSAATDPVNIATLPFGVAKSASVLRAMATEAVIGMGSEALIQPRVESWHTERGLEYNSGIRNVLAAGVVGSGLGGVMQKASNVMSDSAFLTVAKESKGLTSEQKHSIDVLSKNSSVNEKNPFPKKDSVESISHFKSVDDMSKGYVAGKDLPTIELSLSNRNFNTLNKDFRVSDDLMGFGKKLELQDFQNKVFYDLGDLDVKTKNVELTPQASKDFVRFVRGSSAKSATLVPLQSNVKKTRSQVEKIGKELSKKERIDFPNVDKKFQKNNLIYSKREDGAYDVYRADSNIALKKDDKGIIEKFSSQSQANKSKQSGEYVVQVREKTGNVKSSYVVVQGDPTGQAITTNNISKAKFFDEGFKSEPVVRMDENAKAPVDEVPTVLDPIDEIRVLDDFEKALEEIKESTKFDTVSKQLDEMIDTDPNFKVLLDDGTEITIEALKKSIKDNEDIIKQMKVCAI